MKTSVFRLLLSAFTALLSLQANTQEPSFIHYGVDDGMPSNLVYAMAQDKQGFLWFGTDKGLARFDGRRFHVFGMSDGLPDAEILNIKSDSKGTLWLTPFRRNPCFWANGKFHTTETDSFLKSMTFPEASIDFQETADGKLWIFGMTSSVYYLEDSTIHKQALSNYTRKIYTNGSEIFGLGSNFIMQIKSDVSDEKVYAFSGVLGTNKTNYVFDGVDFFKNLILYSIAGKTILIEYVNGIFRVLDIRNDISGRIFSDNNGDFWMCQKKGGAVLLACSSGKIIDKDHYFVENKINYIYKDRQNTTWFCTANEGIYGLPTNTPVSYVKNKHLISGNITALARSNNMGIISGDDEGNIYSIKGEIISHRSLGLKEGYNRILKIISLQDDTQLIACDKGVYRLSKNDVCTELGKTVDYVPAKSILYHRDKIWAARIQNIGYFLDDLHFFAFKKRRYTSMCTDNEGNVWGGGVDGLYSEKDSFISNWGDRFPELSSRIVTLSGTSGSFIWGVTSYHDLLRVTVSKGGVTGVEIMNKTFPAPIKNIKCLFQDDEHNLWMGTNHGVYVFKKDSSIVHYDKHDGIADDDINTLLVDHDTLWIGTSKGLTRMLLKSGGVNASFPTYIVGAGYNMGTNNVFEPFIGDFDQQRIIHIPPSASSLEIQLSGMDYSSRGNIQFECVVTEQFPSLRWLTFDNLSSLIFTSGKKQLALITEGKINLGSRILPGTYRYKFTAINTRGGRSNSPDEVIVVQEAYWHETIWFWLGIWLIVLLILRKIYKMQMVHRDLNTSVSKLRLQALQNQMNPHFIGNSIYAIQQFFYPPHPEKASEYIEVFNRLLRQTMLMSERHFVMFGEELEYYRDYLNMIQLRFGNRFSYSISGTEHIRPVTPFPAMILQSVIENATIHGFTTKGVSKLQISFSKDGEFVHCIIEDNGEGIKATRERARINNSKHKSKGLELLHQRINTMNRLYNLQMQLMHTDLSEIDPKLHGTRVIFFYNPEKVNKQEALSGTPV